MPEEEARQQNDQRLEAAGWQVQGRAELNLSAQPGVVGREFPTATDIKRLKCHLFLGGPRAAAASDSRTYLNFN